MIAVALAASHAHIALRWAVERVAERVLWRGSAEEGEVAKMNVRGVKDGQGDQGEGYGGYAQGQREEKGVSAGPAGAAGAFWNGAEEGAREIARVGKVE